MSSAGSAPTLTLTNGRARTAEFAWMTSASTSLPAPFGPVTSTVTSAGATRVAVANSSCIASLA